MLLHKNEERLVQDYAQEYISESRILSTQ